MHSLPHYFTALFVLCEKHSSLTLPPKWRLPPTHEKEPKGLWLNMMDQTVTTMNPIILIGGLLETMRVLKIGLLFGPNCKFTCWAL